MKKHLSFKRIILGFALLILFLALGYLSLVIKNKVNKNNYCLKEGQYFPWQDYDNHPPCCPGLNVITRDSYYNEEYGCSYSLSSPYICSKCGDGVCGEGENRCNCPTDCVEEDSKVNVIWE